MLLKLMISGKYFNIVIIKTVTNLSFDFSSITFEPEEELNFRRLKIGKTENQFWGIEYFKDNYNVSFENL